MTGEIKVGIIGGTGQLGSASRRLGWKAAVSNLASSGYPIDPEPPQASKAGRRSPSPHPISFWLTPVMSSFCRFRQRLSKRSAFRRPENWCSRSWRVSRVRGSNPHRLGKGRSCHVEPRGGQAAGLLPWCAASPLSQEDRDLVQSLLSACGPSDEVKDEQQIEVFTAITGPVPGFAAFFADCIVDYARSNGVDRHIAERAAKQLILSAGQIMAGDTRSPAEHVQEMVDYAGTTAAGLVKLKELGVSDLISDGLDASTERVRTIAGKA